MMMNSVASRKGIYTTVTSPGNLVVNTVVDSGTRSITNVVTSSGKMPDPLIPHAHSYTSYDYGRFMGEINEGTIVRSGVLGNLGVQNLALHNRGFAATPNNVRNQALQKLNRQTIESNLNLAVSLAEYSQVIRLLREFTPSGIAKRGRSILQTILSENAVSGIPGRARHTAKSLYETRKVSRENQRTAKDLQVSVESSADAWLQYQYGIRPLISDLYGILDLLYRQQLNRARTVEAVSYEALPGRFEETVAFGGIYGNVLYSSEIAGKVLTKFVINLDTSKIDKLASWSSLNPLSVGYELIPLSYVLDWVVDISQFLTLIEASSRNSLAFKSGTETTLFAYDSVTSVYRMSTSGLVKFKNIKGWSEYRNYDRKLLTTYPMPTAPTVKFDLTASQVTTAAALLLQSIKTPIRYVPSKLNTSAPKRREYIGWDRLLGS